MGENYSNADERRQNINKPEDNLSIFLRYNQEMKSLSSEENTYSNIKYMKDKLESMVVSGALKKEDLEYDVLNNHITTATDYLKKTDRTYTDSYNHYIAFRDFQKMVSIFEINEGGGEIV